MFLFILVFGYKGIKGLKENFKKKIVVNENNFIGSFD